MTTRYVFFRTPEGRAYKGTDAKHAPASILAEIGEKSALNADGQVTWNQFVSLKFGVPLASSVVVMTPGRDGEELNENDARRMIWDAIIALLKKAPGRPIRPNELLRQADILAAAFFRKPLSDYLLLSSLSVGDLPVQSVQIREHAVRFLRTRGSRYPLPRVLGPDQHGSAFRNHFDSSAYKVVRITTAGRSHHEAAERAINAMNLLRGLWSFIATYQAWRWRGGAPRKVRVGVIHTGPVHTLHLLNGKPATEDLYWYDPDYLEDQKLFEHEKWTQIEKSRRWAMRRLARLPHRADVEELFIRYALALDQPNLNVAFLQMWGILEKITNTVGTSYDDTIKRATWIHSKAARPIAKEMLESVRCLRNRYVHAGNPGQESEQVAYLVKSILDPHLLQLLHNHLRVESLTEYGDHLALPTDVATLQKRRSMLQRALRFRTPDDTEEE